MPLLSRLHDTQNTRWLSRNYPGIARQIVGFPWGQDELSVLETKAIDELLYLGAGSIGNLEKVLTLSWVQDAVSDTEYDILYWLRALNYEDTDVVSEVITMPFLESSDAADVLALRSMHRVAREGGLTTIVDHTAFHDGITDAETVLFAAIGTIYDSDAINRLLDPGYAAIETVLASTVLTPSLTVSIIRTESQSRPGTMEALVESVAFTEGIMQLPLPIDHVVVLLDDDAVTPGSAGTNYGCAIGFKPEYEQPQDTREWQKLQAGLVHEVAHYYWSGFMGWITEGLANTIEYMHGTEHGLSPGQLRTKRRGCEAHDLKMLSEWDTSPGSSLYACNYYLGERLFLELRDSMDDAMFNEKLGELYHLLLLAEHSPTPDIDVVRQVFSGQAAIVEKHWSGALNAPENRPFDEGKDRTSHDLIQWDQHPTYDGIGSVTFRGTLLNDAVLSEETIRQATEGGGYANFQWASADGIAVGIGSGSILPPLNDGSRWPILSTVATVYQLDDRAFTVTFPFPPSLSLLDFSNYVVRVWGFQDGNRVPSIGENIDLLGYARIRVD